MSSLTSVERLGRDELSAWQGERLRGLLGRIHGRNGFYTRKLAAAGVRLDALHLPGDLSRLPITTKSELIADQAAHAPWGTALTEPLGHYTRYCQTSSTTGRPLIWIDTNESWQWMLECWKTVYRAAGVGTGDRVFFPFSFGPFLGFWTGFEAGCQMGLHCVPGGGMSSQQRLTLIDTARPTVVCCTPTYALRLAEVAAERQASAPLSESSVRVLIVAGEPGGSIHATRERIEKGWGARVIDHHGATEVGPLSFECLEAPGYLHVNEGEYICEVLERESDRPVADGERGELVVTNLGRAASPVLRYRTGDIVVRESAPCRCGRTWARLAGGVLTRSDDMINIRGVNVYPGGIESVIRRVPEVTEFRCTVSWTGSLRSMAVDVEAAPNGANHPRSPGEAVDVEATGDEAAGQEIVGRVAHELRVALGLSVPVRLVATGTLPRFEMKARRFIVEE